MRLRYQLPDPAMVVSWLLSNGGAHLTHIEYWPVNTITWGKFSILRDRRSFENIDTCQLYSVKISIPEPCLGWPEVQWARLLQHQPPGEWRGSGRKKLASLLQPHTWLQTLQPHNQWGSELRMIHSSGSWGGFPGSQESSHTQGPRRQGGPHCWLHRWHVPFPFILFLRQVLASPGWPWSLSPSFPPPKSCDYSCTSHLAQLLTTHCKTWDTRSTLQFILTSLQFFPFTSFIKKKTKNLSIYTSYSFLSPWHD